MWSSERVSQPRDLRLTSWVIARVVTLDCISVAWAERNPSTSKYLLQVSSHSCSKAPVRDPNRARSHYFISWTFPTWHQYSTQVSSKFHLTTANSEFEELSHINLSFKTLPDRKKVKFGGLSSHQTGEQSDVINIGTKSVLFTFDPELSWWLGIRCQEVHASCHVLFTVVEDQHVSGSLLFNLYILWEDGGLWTQNNVSQTNQIKVSIFSLTADGWRLSPFSFQVAWMSLSEISVSNFAVSVSVTSTL